ncbi:unnamed protein product, partial [Symbiodinium microadriaticum]
DLGVEKWCLHSAEMVGVRFVAELHGVVVRRQPTTNSDKVSFLEKGDQITAIEACTLAWCCAMKPSEVLSASNLQKARTQDLGHGAPIRSVVLPAACRSPQELLVNAQPGTAMEPLRDVLTFQPQIRKPRKSQVPPPEHLRDRVLQTRLLDDSLKADCLERLAGAAQRAPMVRRASWSDVAPPPPPESDDEVIEFTKEDLFKEDAPTIEEQPQKSPEASGEDMHSPEPQDEMLDADLRVLTPSERSAPSERREVASVAAMNLTDLLAENEKLRVAAGLSENEHFSWRPGATIPAHSGLPVETSQPRGSVCRKRDTEATDFYGDWITGSAALPHWHYKSSSPFRRRSKTLPKTSLQSSPSAVEALPPLSQALPTSAHLEDARQAIFAARGMSKSPPWTRSALQRRAVKGNEEMEKVFTEQGIEWAKLAKGACAIRSHMQQEVPLDLAEDGFVATALAPFGTQLRKQTEAIQDGAANAVLSKKVINEVLSMSSDPGLVGFLPEVNVEHDLPVSSPEMAPMESLDVTSKKELLKSGRKVPPSPPRPRPMPAVEVPWFMLGEPAIDTLSNHPVMETNLLIGEPTAVKTAPFESLPDSHGEKDIINVRVASPAQEQHLKLGVSPVLLAAIDQACKTA